MDLAKKLQFLALDVISSVALGQEFGNLRTDTDVNGYCKSSEEGLEILNSNLALGTGWIVNIPWLGPKLLPSEKDKTGFGKMMATARAHVNSRLQSSTDERSDMLASFVRHGLSKDELFTETLEQILAGSDTTASALRTIMLHIIANPRVYKILQAEIDQLVKSGKAGVTIPDSEARQLKYLNAVIREGMRMHPPVAGILSKVVPPGGDTVTVEGETVFLPGGVNIGYGAWGMHHNKLVYGENAEQYWPERWLVVDDKEKLALMVKTNDMIFGYGKWLCLGKNIAHIEIGKAIFEVCLCAWEQYSKGLILV
jgi:cytochrome P450